MLRHNRNYLFSILILVLFTAACEGTGNDVILDNDNDGYVSGFIGYSSTAFKAAIVRPGPDCANGGIMVESGIDENQNSLLDADEVDNTEVICNGSDGADGMNSLIKASDELPGVNCDYGGVRIDSGPDRNGNGILDVGAIASTAYICSYKALSFSGLVFVADKNLDNMDELFRTTVDGSSQIKLAGPLTSTGRVVSFKISPDRTKVAFKMEHDDTTSPQVLYVKSLLNQLPAINVSGTLVTGGNVGHYHWSPDSSRLAYMADQDIDEKKELYTVFPDGTGNVKVSGTMIDGGNVSVIFRWSPDSSQLAYKADKDIEGTFELYTVLPDGMDNIKVSGSLVAGGNVLDFQWAPDSSRLAYRADQNSDEVRELYTVSPGGMDNVKVSGNMVAGGNVSHSVYYKWSPDSSRLAYMADEDTDWVIELYTVFPDASNNNKVSGPMVGGGTVSRFRWSPDSSHIAYLADKETDGTDELYTVLPGGRDNIKISGPMVADGDVWDFRWAPDSFRVAYSADEETDTIGELYTVFPDSTNNIKVSGTMIPRGGVSSLGGFYWSPDSSRLAYRANQDIYKSFELYTVFSDGTDNIKVSGDVVTDGNVGYFKWSPDSSRLAYMADQNTDEMYELYTVFSDATNNIKVSGPMVADGDVLGFSW